MTEEAIVGPTDPRPTKRQCLPSCHAESTLSDQDAILLQSIDPAILAKATEKELQAEHDRENRTAEKRLLKNRYARLSPVAKIVRAQLLWKTTPLMKLPDLANKVRYSLANSQTQAEVDETLQLLAQVVPEWCKIYPVNDSVYFCLQTKIAISFQAVLEKLACAAARPIDELL